MAAMINQKNKYITQICNFTVKKRKCRLELWKLRNKQRQGQTVIPDSHRKCH